MQDSLIYSVYLFVLVHPVHTIYPVFKGLHICATIHISKEPLACLQLLNVLGHDVKLQPEYEVDLPVCLSESTMSGEKPEEVMVGVERGERSCWGGVRACHEVPRKG